MRGPIQLSLDIMPVARRQVSWWTNEWPWGRLASMSRRAWSEEVASAWNCFMCAVAAAASSRAADSSCSSSCVCALGLGHNDRIRHHIRSCNSVLSGMEPKK